VKLSVEITEIDTCEIPSKQVHILGLQAIVNKQNIGPLIVPKIMHKF